MSNVLTLNSDTNRLLRVCYGYSGTLLQNITLNNEDSFAKSIKTLYNNRYNISENLINIIVVGDTNSIILNVTINSSTIEEVVKSSIISSIQNEFIFIGNNIRNIISQQLNIDSLTYEEKKSVLLKHVSGDNTGTNYNIIHFANIPVNTENNITLETYDKFSKQEHIVSIEIPNTVTSISESLFKDASNLTLLTFQNLSTLTNIGSKSFKDIGISNIIIPSSVTTIGNEAFLNNSNLTSFLIEANSQLETIGESSFADCSINSIILPQSVTSIGNNAFNNCSSNTAVLMKSINYGNNSNIFANNHPSLESNSYLIENGILYKTKLDASNNLISDLSNELVSITALTDKFDINVLEDHNYFKSITNTTVGIYDGSQNISYVIFNATSSGEPQIIADNAFRNSSLRMIDFNINSNVQSIGSESFKNCTNLKAINIPSSVISISNEAFNNSTNITNITLPANLESIGDNVFSNLSGSITIPTNVTYIGSQPFGTSLNTISFDSQCKLTSIPSGFGTGLTDLSSVILASDGSLNTIESNAFKLSNTIENSNYTSQLSDVSGFSINIPKSVNTIEMAAFQYSHVTSVTFDTNSSLTDISDSIFAYSKLYTINLPNSITSIGNDAFRNCGNISNIVITSNITSLGSSCFRDCANITDVSFNTTSLSEIPERCFENTKLINTVIPEGVTSIGEYAFTNIAPTTTPTFTLPSTLKIINNGAFKKASRGFSFSISIPESVTRIASRNSIGTFAESGLESITFEGTSPIMSFENQTFFKSKLTSINVPKSIQSIGAYTFQETPLSTITFEKDTSLNTIQLSAFKVAKQLSKIIIPAGVTSIGKEAFYTPWNQDSSLNKIIFPEQVTNYEDVFNNPGLYPSNNPIIYVKGKDDGRLYYGTLNADETVTPPTSTGIIDVSSIQVPYSEFLQNFTLEEITDVGYSFNDFRNIDLGSPGVLTSNDLPSPLPTDIVFGTNVTSLNDQLFYQNVDITSCYMQSSVTSIGQYCFAGATNLTSVTLSNSILSLSQQCFQETGLQSITIPSSVTSIGESTFKDCSSLTNLLIPSGVISIGESCFEGCSAVTSIIMPFLDLDSQEKDAFTDIVVSNISNIYIFDSNNNSFYEGEITDSIINPGKIQKTETIVSTIIGFTSDELKEAGYPVTGITIV